MAKTTSMTFEDVAIHALEAFRDANDLGVKIQREGGCTHGRPDARYIRGRKNVCGFDAKKLIKEGDGCQPTRYTVKKENGKLVPTDKTTARDGFKTPAFEKIQKNIEIFAQSDMKAGKTDVEWHYIPDNDEDAARFAALDPDQQNEERHRQEQGTLAQFVAEDYLRKDVDFVIFGKDAKFVSPATAEAMQSFSSFNLTARFIRRGTQDIPKKDRAEVLEALGLSEEDIDVLVERSKGITVFNASNHEISEDIIKAMKPGRSKNSRSFMFTTSEGRTLEVLVQFDRLTDTITLKKRGTNTKGSECSVVVVEKFLGETDKVEEFYTERGWTDVLVKCFERMDKEPNEEVFATLPDLLDENMKKHEHFKTVASHRATEAVKKIEMLGKCADTGKYEYSKEEARFLIDTLKHEIDEIEKQFL